MEDQSIFNSNNGSASTIDEYVNTCIKEVCIDGDSLSKYQKMIEKKYGTDFYQKCNNFVEEVKRSVERRKFTNTSMVNLKYLAKEINVPLTTVDEVMKNFSDQFAKEKLEEEEKERLKLEAEEAERRRKEEEWRRREKEAEKERKKKLALQILKWVGIVAVAGLAIWGIVEAVIWIGNNKWVLIIPVIIAIIIGVIKANN